MSNATDMNIVLGQGSAIKEVHNIGRQNLELNQQFVAQKTEDKKKEDKKKVQDFETGNRIEIKGDEEKKNREDSRYDEEGSKKKKSKEVFDSSGGSLINIKV
jgi:hypothetical protein